MMFGSFLWSSSCPNRAFQPTPVPLKCEVEDLECQETKCEALEGGNRKG